MPRLIYLDQNKWIEFAQAIRDGNKHLLQVLEILRETKRLDLNRFPLSLAHFMETNKRQDIDSRGDLGRLMWELSDGWALAGPGAIRQREIDRALSLVLHRTFNERPFELLGRGVLHASDHLKEGVKLDPERVLPEEVRLALEKAANKLFDKTLLTGSTPWGERPNRPDFTSQETQFSQGLIEARERLADADPDLQRRALYAQALFDILPEVKAALEFHGISEGDFFQLGSEGLTKFIESMPTVKIDIHLRLQWVRNRQLRTKPTDLNDWGYVAPAAAYCDVVVTEKQLADLLNRRLQKRAIVITDLRELIRL
jgi:hypothetical protein